MKMRMSLSERIQLKRKMSDMENIDSGFQDDDMIQHSQDDEMKGDKDMANEGILRQSDEELKEQLRGINNRNKPPELSEEALAEQARIKMGNLDMFPSLSNKSNQEKKDQTISDEEKDELQKKKEVNKLKKEAKERLKQMNSAEEWSFSDTIEICRNKETCKYQTVANAEFLGNLLDRKIAVYVGDLQRGWKSNSKNELVEVRSEKQIKLILNSLLHDKMHGGFITLNLNPNDGYEINFNEDDHTISGSVNQKLQILDGNHRLNAFSRWAKLYKRSPESIPNPADYYISVVIETLNDDDAKSLFSEYATKSLKINRSRGEYLNVEDNTNKLCREIMKKSDIKVEVISTSIKANSENIISFGVLSKNIRDNYSPQTKFEIEKLSNHLTMFVDLLIQTFPNFMASKNLEERKLLREKSLTMEALAWGGYFKLSTFLQDKSKEEILDILSKFNSKVDYKGWSGDFLDKENPIYRKIMKEGFKIINTSSSSTWINKVFVEFIIEGKSLDEIGAEG